jgi:hypothetical protein
MPKPKKRKLTKAQEIAIGECANLFTLLTASDSPHAKELATIVIARLQAVAKDPSRVIDKLDPKVLEMLMSIDVGPLPVKEKP